jgi:hypothetical protein
MGKHRLDTDYEDILVRNELARQNFKTAKQRHAFIVGRIKALKSERWLGTSQRFDLIPPYRFSNESDRLQRISAYERALPYGQLQQHQEGHQAEV